MRIGTLAATAALMLVAGPALAADVYEGSAKDSAPAYAQPGWTGFFIGVGGGGGASVTDVSLDFSNGRDSVELFGLDGIGGEGGLGTVQVGFDKQFGSSFVVGIFADYDFTEIESEARIFDTFKATWTLEDSWSAGGRIGFLTTPDTLVYALAAYTQAEYEFGDDADGLDRFLKYDEFEGITVGGGIETRLHGGWFLKAEYRYTEFDDQDLLEDLDLGGRRNMCQVSRSSNGCGKDEPEVGLDFEPSVHTARAVLSYKFGWEDAAPASYK